MRRFKIFCIVLTLAVGLWVLPAGSGAQSPETTPSVAATHELTGFVGITRGQTARLNVVNLGSQSANVKLQLISLNGPLAVEQCAQECIPGQPCPQACTLQTGGEIFVEFNADQLALAPGARLPIRAAVSMNPSARDVITTFEIYDNATGRTSIVIPCVVRMN